MCDRYALTAELEELTKAFQIENVHVPYRRRYNIAPTQLVPVVQQIGAYRCLSEQRWGLMPYWGKNAVHVEVDMLGRQHYLQTMLMKTRCVVPCSGFYVWERQGKTNTAWHVVRSDRQPFAMPAIYDTWLDSERKAYPMCTVITSGVAYGSEQGIPLMLDADAMDTWLDQGTRSGDLLESLLRSLPDAEFHRYPVTPLVSNERMEAPECVAELTLSFGQVRS